MTNDQSEHLHSFGHWSFRYWAFPSMPLRRPPYEVPDTVLRQLRRRRWTRRSVLSLVIALAASALLDRRGCFHYRGDDWRVFDKQTAVVTHVSDGDTVRIRLSPLSAEETVRLLGIDAPEIAHKRGETDAHWGREAANYLRQQVEGKTITI